MLFSILAFFTLFIFILTAVIAINGNHKYYWVAAVSIYIFSFFSGFSVGQVTVGLTFIMLTLAIGYSLKWIKTKVHTTIFVVIGFLIAYLLITFVDDGYIFYPFTLFM